MFTMVKIYFKNLLLTISEENGEEEWDEEEEEEGAGEEEGDWEWEYYSNEEGEETEDEPPKEVGEVKEDKLMPTQLNAASAWIVKGLKQMVPRIPNKSDTEKLQKNEESDEEEQGEEVITSLKNNNITCMILL